MSATLAATLDAIRHRDFTLQRRARVLTALAGWFALAMALLGFDAGWSSIGAWTTDDPYTVVELPVTAREVMLAMLLIAAAWVVARLRLPRRVADRPLDHYARRADAARDDADHHILTALQLGREQSSRNSEGITAALARRVITEGTGRLSRIESDQLIDRDPLARSYRFAVTVVIGWLVIWPAALLLPGPHPLAVAATRLADPLGDHPPYTMTRFVVTVEPSPVADGDAPKLRARLDGRAGSEARLRLADGTTLPMRRSDTDRAVFTARLEAVREPIAFRIEAANGRSRWQRIDPVRLPRIMAVELAALPPSGEGDPVPLRYPPGGPIRLLEDAVLSVHIASDLDEARIDHPAAGGRRLVTPTPDGEQTLTLRLVTSEGLRSREVVELTLVGLSASELAELDGGPDRGIDPPTETNVVHDAARADAVAGADEPARDAAQAPIASGTPMPGPSTPTADSASLSPASDGQAGRTGSAAPTTAAGRGGTPTDADDSGPTDPLATGVTIEQADAARAREQAARSFADRAPARYRDLVAAYYLRIAEDRHEESSR
jgi:hypothetical protein